MAIPFDYEEEKKAFLATFKILSQQTESDSFRRYVPEKERFNGGFLVSAYEAVALGIGHNYKKVQHSPPKVQEKVKGIWKADEFRNNSRSGIGASSRVPRTIPFGRKIFSS